MIYLFENPNTLLFEIEKSYDCNFYHSISFVDYNVPENSPLTPKINTSSADRVS